MRNPIPKRTNSRIPMPNLFRPKTLVSLSDGSHLELEYDRVRKAYRTAWFDNLNVFPLEAANCRTRKELKSWISWFLKVIPKNTCVTD